MSPRLYFHRPHFVAWRLCINRHTHTHTEWVTEGIGRVVAGPIESHQDYYNPIKVLVFIGMSTTIIKSHFSSPTKSFSVLVSFRLTEPLYLVANSILRLVPPRHFLYIHTQYYYVQSWPLSIIRARISWGSSATTGERTNKSPRDDGVANAGLLWLWMLWRPWRNINARSIKFN